MGICRHASVVFTWQEETRTLGEYNRQDSILNPNVSGDDRDRDNRKFE